MDYLTHIFTVTKTESHVMAAGSAIGAFASFLLGGFDAPVQAVVVLIIADYITGMIAAWKTGALSSSKGYRGLLKKVVILMVVALANMLDTAMSMHTLRTMAVCGYAAMEGLSLMENLDRAGYGDCIPEFLRNKLAQLRDEKGLKI